MSNTWCPTCRDWSVQNPGRPCAWCDTTVIVRRGGWKRPDRRRTSLISRDQALALHRAHENGQSLRALSRLTWETLGYRTPGSCLAGIIAALDREGLRTRDQQTATAVANTKRGGRLPGENKNAYRRRLRREHGYRCHRTGEWRVAS